MTHFSIPFKEMFWTCTVITHWLTKRVHLSAIRPPFVHHPSAIRPSCCSTRVQQEQLAAIFLLLRENAEALGEVTEGDMEEQLKLYSL